MSASAHTSFRRWIWVLCAAVLLAPAAVSGQSQAARGLPQSTPAAPPERRQVLVLDSFQYGSPVTDSVNRGIIAALTKGGFSIGDIYVEGLDLVRRPDSQHWANEANLLRQKHAGDHFPIIIAEGAFATEFISRQGTNFFPEAAVLALLNAGVSARNSPRRVMDMSERMDLAGTLRAALDLFPKTQRVFVVVGGRGDVFPVLDKAGKEFAPWTNRLTFEYTSEMTYAEIMRRAAALPPETIILYTPFFSDASGQSFAAIDVLDKLTQTASVPIFATLEAYLGRGIIGGSLVRTEAIGQQAGKLALDYLNGRIQLVEPVTAFDIPSSMMFDWRELIRWKADIARLPRDSLFINRPVTLWSQYKGEVMVAAAVFVALSSLILTLLVLNRRLKRMEIAASESEARFRVMVERAPEAVIVYDMDSKRIVEANPKAERLFGCSREKLLESGVEKFYPPLQPDGEEVAQSILAYSLRAMAGEEVVLERFIHSDDGRDLTCEVRLVRLPYPGQRLVRSSLTDITGRKRAEAAVRASLDEKTALLKEVHHRVKNNLQIVSSLLSLQADRVRNATVSGTLQDTQNRVRSMALIHETLYRSENLARVNFAAYVDNLCAYLSRAFAVDSSRIQLVSRVAGGGLELDEAVPCGLIINELISNALKHAFPDGRAGQITLELKMEPGGLRTLRVADNGVGFPAGLDLEHTGTLGLQLVSNLADQLGGMLQVERTAGTAFHLTFHSPAHQDRQ